MTIPAALLAQQQRTQTIFTYVMVAIAAISLLVGGIGIMNIVLATVLERTREIGIRRSVGARRFDIVRQFLTESVLISVGGGSARDCVRLLPAWLIARTAEWKTIVTTASVVIAFGVSVAVGVVFGIYPAMKASRINPIDALAVRIASSLCGSQTGGPFGAEIAGFNSGSLIARYSVVKHPSHFRERFRLVTIDSPNLAE